MAGRVMAGRDRNAQARGRAAQALRNAAALALEIARAESDGNRPWPVLVHRETGTERIVLKSTGTGKFYWAGAHGAVGPQFFCDEGGALTWAINRGYAVRRTGTRILGTWRRRRAA